MKATIVCYGSAKILRWAFVISLIRDMMQYNNYANSAPFYIFVLGNAAVTLLPAAVMYILAKYFEKKDI